MTENTSTQPGEWLTEQQLADHLHVSVRHMANLRKAGLPFVQLGSSVRYNLAEIEAYLCGNRRLSSHVERKRRQANLPQNLPQSLGGILP